MAETRKIAAILAADVVGLAGWPARTRTARSRGCGHCAANSSIPPSPCHNGRVFKRTGDGALVEFRSVVEAVRCAIEVQNAHGRTQRRHAGRPAHRLPYRHSSRRRRRGERRRPDGRRRQYRRALGRHRRARRDLLSEQAYRQVKGRLDLAVTDLGPTQLKNIAEPVRAYSLQVGVPAVAKPATQARGRSRRAKAFALQSRSSRRRRRADRARRRRLALPRRKPTALRSREATAPARSIVVLPSEQSLGRRGAGLSRRRADRRTDDLHLARLPGTFVIARNTAFTYKGKPIDVKAIGKDLGVKYALEGSVQPTATRIRVNAQLIDAETGAHLWAESFDEDRADLLQMEDDIVTRLARTLDLKMTDVEAAEARPAASRQSRRPGPGAAMPCSRQRQWADAARSRRSTRNSTNSANRRCGSIPAIPALSLFSRAD